MSDAVSGARAPDRLCEARPGRLPRLDDQQNLYSVIYSAAINFRHPSHPSPLNVAIFFS
ncbi:hypothetical protein GCM10027287_32640 [Bordetella muralis]